MSNISFSNDAISVISDITLGGFHSNHHLKENNYDGLVNNNDKCINLHQNKDDTIEKIKSILDSQAATTSKLQQQRKAFNDSISKWSKQNNQDNNIPNQQPIRSLRSIQQNLSNIQLDSSLISNKTNNLDKKSKSQTRNSMNRSTMAQNASDHEFQQRKLYNINFNNIKSEKSNNAQKIISTNNSKSLTKLNNSVISDNHHLNDSKIGRRNLNSSIMSTYSIHSQEKCFDDEVYDPVEISLLYLEKNQTVGDLNHSRSSSMGTKPINLSIFKSPAKRQTLENGNILVALPPQLSIDATEKEKSFISLKRVSKWKSTAVTGKYNERFHTTQDTLFANRIYPVFF